jgi:16S rRNA processing protein RimM
MPSIHNRSRNKNPKDSPYPEGESSFLAVARVRRPFGVRGELLLEMLTESPQRLLQAKTLFVGEEHRPETVTSVRRHGKDMLLFLESVIGRDAAEPMRNQVLYDRIGDLPSLPAGVFYHHQIEGLRVLSEAGEALGVIREILKTGANDVYVVRGERGEILLPAIPQVILLVDLAAGSITVRLLEGLEWIPTRSGKDAPA